MRNPHKLPRRPHCIGCGVTFSKMHLMIYHRRLAKCGGRFLPSAERELRLAAKQHWQLWLTSNDSGHHAHWQDMTHRANLLRKRRLDEHKSQAAAR